MPATHWPNQSLISGFLPVCSDSTLEQCIGLLMPFESGFYIAHPSLYCFSELINHFPFPQALLTDVCVPIRCLQNQPISNYFNYFYFKLYEVFDFNRQCLLSTLGNGEASSFFQRERAACKIPRNWLYEASTDINDRMSIEKKSVAKKVLKLLMLRTF